MALEQVRDLRARRGEQLRVLGQLGNAIARQPALQRPQNLALAAQNEIDLGQREAVGGARDGVHAALRQPAVDVREQDALALVSAAANAAAQLVQLREAE